MAHSMASNKEDVKKRFSPRQPIISVAVIFIANAITKISKNHLPASWQFTLASVNLQLKSSRRKLAAKVVKKELN